MKNLTKLLTVAGISLGLSFCNPTPSFSQNVYRNGKKMEEGYYKKGDDWYYYKDGHLIPTTNPNKNNNNNSNTRVNKSSSSDLGTAAAVAGGIILLDAIFSNSNKSNENNSNNKNEVVYRKKTYEKWWKEDSESKSWYQEKNKNEWYKEDSKEWYVDEEKNYCVFKPTSNSNFNQSGINKESAERNRNKTRELQDILMSDASQSEKEQAVLEYRKWIMNSGELDRRLKIAGYLAASTSLMVSASATSAWGISQIKEAKEVYSKVKNLPEKISEFSEDPRKIVKEYMKEQSEKSKVVFGERDKKYQEDAMTGLYIISSHFPVASDVLGEWEKGIETEKKIREILQEGN